MKTMKLRCAAKINLSLDVTGRRQDGYHTLESIFQSVSVYDILTVTAEEGSGIVLTCDIPHIPLDERNLAYKAAAAMLKAAGKNFHVRMHLEKHIPSGAGMGGGSADAAGVLYALNILTGCGFSDERLREIGVSIGADVPFLLLGGTALAEGIGEVLTPLPALKALPLVILKGTESISTPEAYRAVDSLCDPLHPDTDAMLRAIRSGNIKLLTQSCGNLFERAVNCGDVRRAEQALLEHGALCAVMTGSGSAVFGIFPDEETAYACVDAVGDAFAFAQACSTVSRPFDII
jgi:4-diphosphocytidyl-2-C-methyl-D-erythritol kinase